MPMVGSPVVAGLIAQLLFWLLLSLGWRTGELGPRGALLFLALWLAGWFGLPAQAMFTSLVAVLDIALVFMVFHGDVRLT